MMAGVLNQCQAQWALSLFQFQFVITYCPRRQQGELDVLSHCLYLMLKERDVAYDQWCDTIFKPKNLWLQALLIIPKDNTFFNTFVKIYSMILLLFLLKVIGITLLMISTNSSSWWFVISWWIVIHTIRLYMISSSPSETWHIGCWPFWIEQDHGISVLWLLMAATLEIHERNFGITWCLCSCKKSLSSPSWTFLTTIGPYFTMVFNLHWFHHGSSMI